MGGIVSSYSCCLLVVNNGCNDVGRRNVDCARVRFRCTGRANGPVVSFVVGSPSLLPIGGSRGSPRGGRGLRGFGGSIGGGLIEF